MRFLCFSLLLVFALSCNNENVNRTELIRYTPANASIILRTNNIQSLKNSLNNSGFFDVLSKTNAHTNLEDNLENMSLSNTNEDVLICFSKDKSDSIQSTIITKHTKNLFITDSLKNHKE